MCCCRLIVESLVPVPAVAVSILTIGQFQPLGSLPGQAVRWERQVPEEGAVVTAVLTGDSLELSIAPSISTFAHHAGKRIAAGIYFEIAAKYAEKVDGVIRQRATVEGCKLNGTQELLLARYPEMPLSFDRVCAGFRLALLADSTL